LEFGKFVIPQVLENLVYNVAVVFFAWRGFGIASFTYSVLIRGIIGLISIYVLQPWKPGIALSKKSLRGLLKFGLPYQLNNFLATVKDDGMTIVLGGILGSYGLGILGTAQKLAQYPLRFFMDNVTKVTFPAFSRMQDDKRELAKSLSRSIFFISVLVFPSLVGLVVLFPVLIGVIPKYQKWAPAFIPLALLSLNSFWAAVTTQLTNFLNSVGRIKTTFKLMIMWTVLTWVLVPFLSRRFGVAGGAFAYCLVGLSSIVVFYLVKRFLDWSIKESVLKPFLASFIMGVVIFLLRSFSIFEGTLGLIILIFVGGVSYAGFLYLLVGNSLIYDAKKIFSDIFSR